MGFPTASLLGALNLLLLIVNAHESNEVGCISQSCFSGEPFLRQNPWGWCIKKHTLKKSF